MSRRRALMSVVAVDTAAVIVVLWLAVATNQYGVPLAPGEVALPTLSEQIDVCAGIGLAATLHGDPSDPRVAWLGNEVGGPGDRMDVVWPRGYRARFTPELVVLDQNDRPVIREGDSVDGTCGKFDRYWLLSPPFTKRSSPRPHPCWFAPGLAAHANPATRDGRA